MGNGIINKGFSVSDRFAVWIRSPLGHSLLALLLGMLSVMGFAPHNIPEAVLLSVMGLLGLLAQSHHWKQGAWIGGFYGLGLFGFGMNWLGISLTVYGGVPFGFGWLMVLGLAVILASFIALFAGIAVYLKRSVALWFWAIFLIPSLWTLNEWLRVILWDGFPWLLFAYSHVDTWLVSWAQMGGNLAVTFVVMMSAGILWWLWISGQWLTGGLAFACLWGISWQLQSVSWVSPKGDAVPVALLHTQISERLKWQASQQDGFIEAQIQASQRVLTEHPNVKLIVWPETAIPTFIDSVQEQLLPLQTKALSRGVTVLAGTAIREAHLDGKQYFNSISTLDGQTHYDKRHLVPFSEYYPAFGVLNALASFIGMPMAQFSEGQSARMMQLGHQQVGLGVCYEADFLHELVAINSTTDW
jgi:apolipoprotein N-acyltransferase